MKPSPRQFSFGLIRILVSFGLLAWLLNTFWGTWSRLQALEPLKLWPAVLVFALSCHLGALQWTLLLRHLRVALPKAQLVRAYWVGLFFNNFLPGSVGGDVAKVAQVGAATGRLAPPAAATILDRLIGLLALVGLALVAGGALGGARPAGLPWWVLMAIALSVIALAAAFLSRRLCQLIVTLFEALRLGALAKPLAKLGLELRAYRLAPKFLAKMALLAALVQALRVFTHVAVACAMGIPLSPVRILDLFVLVPVLALAMMLPISLNGLGVRELAATQLLPAIGIPPEEAFVLQLATYLVQVAVSLLGGVVFAQGMATRCSGGREVHSGRWPRRRQCSNGQRNCKKNRDSVPIRLEAIKGSL